jgi:hypothetical protein
MDLTEGSAQPQQRRGDTDIEVMPSGGPHTSEVAVLIEFLVRRFSGQAVIKRLFRGGFVAPIVASMRWNPADSS